MCSFSFADWQIGCLLRAGPGFEKNPAALKPTSSITFLGGRCLMQMKETAVTAKGGQKEKLERK